MNTSASLSPRSMHLSHSPRRHHGPASSHAQVVDFVLHDLPYQIDRKNWVAVKAHSEDLVRLADCLRYLGAGVRGDNIGKLSVSEAASPQALSAFCRTQLADAVRVGAWRGVATGAEAIFLVATKNANRP